MKFFWVSKEKEESYEVASWEIEIENNDFIDEEEWQVALDIVENSKEIIIISPIAWVNLEDIDISLNDNVLTISGIRKRPDELYSDDSVLRTSETFWGKFSRNIILPDNTSLDEIKAILEKNILILRVPKIKFKSKSIEIEEVENQWY